MSRAFYNEHDPKAAAWLRELIKEGHIADGIVDERDIQDVQPNELSQYTQCHFFAGIGGWSYALRLAGWPDDEPVWTGSCPCQPFSGAGRQRGFNDPRHLWPIWFNLIRQCGPTIVFGEQVANATEWLDLVSADMENAGYAIGAANLPAASVGAPHYRYRIYFVAHANSARLEGLHPARGGKRVQSAQATIPGHNWKAHPEVLRTAHGFSRKLDKPEHYKERIRALGNAIVPQVAAEFVKAYRETLTHAHPNTHEA